MKLYNPLLVITLAEILSGCSAPPKGLLPATAAPAARVSATTGTAVTVVLSLTNRSHAKHANYLSPGSAGVTIGVYPHGRDTAAHLIARQVADIAPGSPACTGTGSLLTCKVSVQVTPTSATGDDLIISDYDTPPVHDAIPKTAHLLGYANLQNETIPVKGAAFRVFLSGVVAGLPSADSLVSLPGDGSPHQVLLFLHPTDFGNNPIHAGKNDPYANPITVTFAESGGSGHATLLLNGTPVTSAVVSRTSQTVALGYDGKGAIGYTVKVSIKAKPFHRYGGASQTVQVSPLIVASTNAEYVAPQLAFAGNGDFASMTVGEAGATSGTLTLARSNCNAIADVSGFVAPSPSSAAFAVLARSLPSTPAPGTTGCTLAVSDGVSTVNIAVTNRYMGVLGTPVITTAALAKPTSAPAEIAVGPDGALWFAEYCGDALARITPTVVSAPVTEFPIPADTNTPTPGSVTAGPDGNVWYTDYYGSTVGEMTPSGISQSFTTQNTSTAPYAIVTGSDNALWFTENKPGGNAIGRITTDGLEKYFAIASPSSNPDGITVGPDGNLWFTLGGIDQVGYVTPAGVINSFEVTSFSSPEGLTTGPDGALWFTERNADQIGRITTDGTIAEYHVPTASADPVRITTGPDGALWFTECGAAKIGRIDPSKAVPNTSNGITEYTVPTGPFGITAGPDGGIWFTAGSYGELAPATIGKIALETSK
jgi:virginiamycin B lyase